MLHFALKLVINFGGRWYSLLRWIYEVFFLPPENTAAGYRVETNKTGYKTKTISWKTPWSALRGYLCRVTVTSHTSHHMYIHFYPLLNEKKNLLWTSSKDSILEDILHTHCIFVQSFELSSVLIQQLTTCNRILNASDQNVTPTRLWGAVAEISQGDVILPALCEMKTAQRAKSEILCSHYPLIKWWRCAVWKIEHVETVSLICPPPFLCCRCVISGQSILCVENIVWRQLCTLCGES